MRYYSAHIRFKASMHFCLFELTIELTSDTLTLFQSRIPGALYEGRGMLLIQNMI